LTTPTGASDDLEPEIEWDDSATRKAESDPEPPPATTESTTEPPPEALEGAPPGAAVSSKTKPFQSLLDLLHDLAIAVIVCVLLITYVVQAFKVQGTSMSPELADGERILVNKFIYYVDDIERGDVVVFWYPEDPDLSFIKRVIALPGETVEIRSGDVYVNGRLLDEPYVSDANADRRSFPPQEIRPGHYFVLGDNRRGSNDSRSWGLVPERYIYGKAILRLWPPAEMGRVH
jgi:signal peptidase I